MAVEDWHALNCSRVYPFTGLDPVLFSLIADAGFVLSPAAGFDPAVHDVRLQRVIFSAGVAALTFQCSAPGATDDLTFEFDAQGEPFRYLESESDGGDPPVWGGWLVTGRARPALPTTGGLLPDAVVEPANLQSLGGGLVTGVRIANRDRTRVSVPGCPPPLFPVDPQPYWVRDGVLSGRLRFEDGYNAAVSQYTRGNAIRWSASAGAGAGAPCGEAPLHDQEYAPPGLAHLDGSPGCGQVLRSLNGLTGPSIDLVPGPGVSLTPHPASHELVVAVSLDQMAACRDETAPVPAASLPSVPRTDGDLASLQAALAAAAGVGGTVSVPAGTRYQLDTPLLLQGGPANNPLRLVADAGSDRPLFQSGHNGPGVLLLGGHAEVEGLEVLPLARAADDNRQGVSALAGHLTVTDCRIAGWRHNIFIQGAGAGDRVLGALLRRNILTGAWGSDTGAACGGVLVAYAQSATLEDCVLDRNGFRDGLSPPATRGRGIDYHHTCVDPLVSRRNLICNSGSDGEYSRPGLAATHNLYFDNPTGSVATAGSWTSCGVAFPRDLAVPGAPVARGEGLVANWRTSAPEAGNLTADRCWFAETRSNERQGVPLHRYGAAGAAGFVATDNRSWAWPHDPDHTAATVPIAPVPVPSGDLRAAIESLRDQMLRRPLGASLPDVALFVTYYHGLAES